MKLNRFKLLALYVSILQVMISHSSQAEEQWRYAAEAYLWGASIDIETPSGSNTEITFTDIVDDFEFGAMALLAAQRGRWIIGADIIYLDIDDNVEEAVQPGVELNDLAIEAWVAQPVVGYQVLESDHHNLHVLLGARYLWIDVSTKLDFTDPNPSGTSEASVSDGSWDGTLGVRGQWRFQEHWYLSYHLDAGTGDSDSTWQALAALGYRFANFDVVFGYRYLDWKDTENDALEDLSMGGFMAGLKFFF